MQDNNPKTAAGQKKAPVHLFPPVALLRAAEVFRLGASKYGPYNWRESAVSSTVYYSAAMRHLMQWLDGEDVDEESGQPHLAHVMCCMAILMDADSLGVLIDDRQVPGKAGEVIKQLMEDRTNG